LIRLIERHFHPNKVTRGKRWGFVGMLRHFRFV